MLSGFAALLLDLDAADNARAAAQSRSRARAAEARDLWRECKDRTFVKAIGQMVHGMGDMARNLAAQAAELRRRSKAEGRARLAALIAEVDASIAAGLISGEQGARLDAAIARAAEGLRV